MKILLTGATGYIGKRLLPALVENGYQVICCVRDKVRFNPPASLLPKIEVIEVDVLDPESLKRIPKDIVAAYYLIHSMSASSDYEKLEMESAKNFRDALGHTSVKQVIYLGGIVNEEKLSKHLSSRKRVEDELSKGSFHLTSLRAGIIIGSGSASFEIIRDLVEKLPAMITPKWLNTFCQPIGISDVISFLRKSLLNKETYDQDFDIGGPDILSYKEMLLQFAEKRNLKRRIYIIPIMTPRLSSYWLYFMTSTSYKLAIALVNSMKVEVICRNNDLSNILNIVPVSYEESLTKAFAKIQSNEIVSSWKDAHISGNLNMNISDFINVPSFGCFSDVKKMQFDNRNDCVNRVWKIGGTNGWYYGNWLWKVRGGIDEILGGVGLRRGRTSMVELNAGDSVDFWRVLYANKKEGRLLLLAEMKLPGEAWLEFNISDSVITQKATFRPLGLLGRVYWYSVLPFHGLIFQGMVKKLALG